MIIKISSWYNLYVDIWLEFDFYYWQIAINNLNKFSDVD